jgi:hypothetical protein
MPTQVSGLVTAHEVIEGLDPQIVHHRVQSPSSVDFGDLLDEEEPTSLDIQGEGVDHDARLRATKHLGHGPFWGLVHRGLGEEWLTAVHQVHRGLSSA